MHETPPDPQPPQENFQDDSEISQLNGTSLDESQSTTATVPVTQCDDVQEDAASDTSTMEYVSGDETSPTDKITPSTTAATFDPAEDGSASPNSRTENLDVQSSAAEESSGHTNTFTSTTPDSPEGSSHSQQNDIALSGPGWGTVYESFGTVRSSGTHGAKENLDLLFQIKGMFRLLDLYSEIGSGGLVDKVIIDQDSLRSLINTLYPNACQSLMRINFSCLDQLSITITGVYGSKGEIVRFLKSLNAIDNTLMGALLRPEEGGRSNIPTLRSGLYFLLPPSDEANETSVTPRVAYVLYWPEDTTWDDKAVGSVTKNRVTFMRYLTRLADQIVALISPDHEGKLVWKSVEPQANQDFEDLAMEEGVSVADFDRLFEFEVVKKKEQEEGVVAIPGFKVDLEHRRTFPLPDGAQGPSLMLEPKLAISESHLAYLTGNVSPAQTESRDIQGEYTITRFKSLLHNWPSIYVDDTVTPEGIRILLREGDLRLKTRGLEKKWETDRNEAREHLSKESDDKIEAAVREIKASEPSLALAAQAVVIRQLAHLYPFLEITRLYRPATLGGLNESYDESLKFWERLTAIQPALSDIFEAVAQTARFQSITANNYMEMKRRFLGVKGHLDSSSVSAAERKELFFNPTQKGGIQPSYKDVAAKPNWIGVGIALSWGKKAMGLFGANAQQIRHPSPHFPLANGPLPKDPDFFESLRGIVDEEPGFDDAARLLKDFALAWAQETVATVVPNLVVKLVAARQAAARDQGSWDMRERGKMKDKELFGQFRQKLRDALGGNTSPLRITHVAFSAGSHSRDIFLKATLETRVVPSILYDLHFLELTEEDRQNAQQDPQFVPTPKIRPPINFQIPLGFELREVYLLGKSPTWSLSIFCTSQHILFCLGDCRGIGRSSPTKKIPYPWDAEVLFAVDEVKRVLAMLISRERELTLQLFAFDEGFATIHSRGSPLSVSQWYQDGPPEPKFVCFVAGTEDLCILEKSGRIRVYSFISQAFRPATLQLHAAPSAFFCTPDGSALIAVEAKEEGFTLRVFHTATFGVDPQGTTPLQEVIFANGQSFAVTSMGNRGNVHVLGLCGLDQLSIQSVSLKISNKTTDFQYQSKGEQKSRNEEKDTIHNSLIDCLSDVWTRYPVVPAIKREPISSDTRLRPSITYASGLHHDRFRPYFKQMVRDFEASTHKPTEGRLDAIYIRALAFHDVITALGNRSLQASSFRAGEWLVELLCLIPIHIAIARDNRFVPLNNGIIDASVEQRLLGADVSRIVDALQLGWYESIFNCYMASKPVKVISSMGEQSVGKSYALNHIIDSSFAGSAVRTTEGVWLSLCPTRDMLIVALDFEGVHSLERTPQEDMLLVLFNTAISNMVIFRNNFAFSRDVANMFTSFQSSTSVLDPASNPKLFKGVLVVVIKDVVEADKNEIVKEFKSKFTQIVSEEQGTNFISVLHDGQTLFAPWPVIQSRNFYSLFSGLRIKLSQQSVTHPSAGEFLLTLKTLMAKLKAQDWGAIDQNLTKHRVNTLSNLLVLALTTGFSELEPVPEPLKNLETQSAVPDFGDSNARFCLSKSPEELQACLSQILTSWNVDSARHDMGELDAHLQQLVEARISHVQGWLTTNVARFSHENADVRALKRNFEDECDKLRLSVQVCHVECSLCHLPCTRNRLHDQNDHNCGTSHQCLDQCQFMNEHGQSDPTTSCGLRAGHGGRHMCNPKAHCCGEPCEHSGKKGCQRSCNREANHEDGPHLCSARIHQCGKECDLRNVLYLDNQGMSLRYSCPNTCSEPYDIEHDHHACDEARSCPFRCELCPRLCALGDHFHGLKGTEPHLCGQEHQCIIPCSARGICEINTSPRSVETTFTGVYETFQYTKYTQVARRLPCAIPILPGERGHSGAHIHSTAIDIFHFCEASCPNCGYICTLPLGHPQLEHETSHGSMDNTIWAIEGATDAAIEVQGRKYAPQETGAPHLCNLVCAHQGRHAHIDYCRAINSEPCREDESMHIDTPMLPNPRLPKDWVSHSLFWKRTGFRDPYSRDEQAEFALCDVECPGPEHQATPSQPANTSFCTLRIFHPPHPAHWQDQQGYVTSDGHAFSCTNPNNFRQAFHVIFVLDKSGSMSSTDRRPLHNTPASAVISNNHNNRLGAVCSALEAFWISRQPNDATSARRDSYSVIAFDRNAKVVIANDFTSTPNQLIVQLLDSVTASGGTSFSAAIQLAQTVMEQYWSTDLSPVVIFLSDGEGDADQARVHDLCNRAVARGKPLSFHAVSFGTSRYTSSLQQMVEICNQVSQNAPRDPLTTPVPSSYSDAIDTIRLTETFMTISESLKKTRAALISSNR